MTIKTSSRRRSGLWTTYADTLKRNRGLLIFSLLLMLAAPAHVLLSAYNSETYPSFSFYVWSRLLLWIAIAVPAVLSAVVPFIVFHYLHSRRAIDLYHALPIKRSSLFFGKFLTGLTMVMLPTVVGLGSAYLLGAALFANDSITPIAWRVMLFSLCLYVFVVFVIVCCGTAWESILYATGLLIAVFCFGYSIPELMRPLYGYAGGAELEHWLLSIAPFYYLLADWSFFSIVPVLMAGVLLGLSFLLYRNRKSENTGSAFSYRFLFHIISLFISIAMVFFIYTWLQDLLPALLFGFLGYFILSVIANRGFKKLIPVIIRGAGVVVVMTVFILTFEATGGLGYETRIPALNGVKSVTLRGIEVGDYETYLTDYDNGYTMSDIEEKTYREKENIELVRELHAQILQERDGVSGNVIETPIILEYRLNNGLTVTRRYSSVSEKGFRKIVELNRSQEFAEQKYPFLADDFHYDSESQAVIMEPFSARGEIENYETLDVSAEEVAQALKKDILARPAGFEAAPTSDYIGRIAILSPREKPLLPESFFSPPVYYELEEPSEHRQIVLVYECDHNILALLEEQGKLEDFRGRAKEIVDPLKITLFVPDDPHLFNITNKSSNGGHHHDKYDYPEQKKYIIYKPEDRAFLLQHLQPVYYSETACSVVSFSNYSFLLPNSYQTELKEIINRAKMGY